MGSNGFSKGAQKVSQEAKAIFENLMRITLKDWGINELV